MPLITISDNGSTNYTLNVLKTEILKSVESNDNTNKNDDKEDYDENQYEIEDDPESISMSNSYFMKYGKKNDSNRLYSNGIDG